MSGSWQIAAFAALSAALIGGAGLLFYLLQRVGHRGVGAATLPEEQPTAAPQGRQPADYILLLCLMPLVAYLLIWSLVARRLPIIGLISGLALGVIALVALLVASAHATGRG